MSVHMIGRSEYFLISEYAHIPWLHLNSFFQRDASLYLPSSLIRRPDINGSCETDVLSNRDLRLGNHAISYNMTHTHTDLPLIFW